MHINLIEKSFWRSLAHVSKYRMCVGKKQTRTHCRKTNSTDSWLRLESEKNSCNIYFIMVEGGRGGVDVDRPR